MAAIEVAPPVRGRIGRLLEAAAKSVGLHRLCGWERELRGTVAQFSPQLAVVVPYRSWDGLAALTEVPTLYFAEEDPAKQLSEPRTLGARLLERCVASADRRLGGGPDVVAVIGDRERAWAERAFPASAVRTIPHTIDLDYWSGAEIPESAEAPIEVLCVGLLDHPRNADGLAAVLDAVLTLRADNPPQVVGATGTGPMRGLMDGREAALEIVEGEPDLRPLYARAEVALVPSFLVPGVKTTILQAFAMGVPVVTTSVAAESLGLVAGRDALVGSTPTEVARALLRALDDDDLRVALARAGQDFVHEQHGRTAFARALWSAVQLTAEARSRRG